MTVFLIFLVFGMADLCLGYAVSVYLGYGPPGLNASWEAVQVMPRAVPTMVTLPPESPAPVLEPAQGAPPVDSGDDMLGAADSEDGFDATAAVDMLDESGTDEALIQPYSEAYDDDVVEILRRETPTNWTVGAKFVETSISNLNIAMMKSGARATELDGRLRACRGNTDVATIGACVAQLKEDCQTYLTELSEAAERFQGQFDGIPELASLAADNEMATLEQTAQIETTLSNLDHMDFRQDLEAANHRLLEELDHLRVARHRWRDTQEAAFLVVAMQEDSMDKIDPQVQSDTLTGLRNRVGIELTLWRYWKEGKHQQRPISAVMLDVDGLGKVNQQYGATVGDRILYQIARYLEVTVSDAALIGRFEGGRFFVVILDAGSQPACHCAERVRQAIERMTFIAENSAVRLTVSGAVAEAMPEDHGHEVFLGRLKGVVRQAKTAGPNCLYLHDGKENHPVVEVPMSVEEMEITI
jgi:diguanylate cyclase